MLENQNNVNDAHIVGPPFWCGEEGGVEPRTKVSKGDLIFALKEGVTFFRGVEVFTWKIKVWNI